MFEGEPGGGKVEENGVCIHVGGRRLQRNEAILTDVSMGKLDDIVKAMFLELVF